MRTLRTIRIALLALLVAAVPAGAFGAIAVSITIAPPVLPVYTQPPCPADGFLWTPGYWGWGPAGYYWIPGVWVRPPAVGLLWTPGYWGFVGGAYIWHGGYWGPHIGFYGGVHYGFGYDGVGFVGGRWVGGHFAYNTAVVNVNRTVVHNTYVDRSVIHNTNINRASFNGRGGINARPTPQQDAAARQRRFGPTSTQSSHAQTARENRGNFNANRPANRGAYNAGRPANERPNAAREGNQRPNAARQARPAQQNRGNSGKGGDAHDRNPR